MGQLFWAVNEMKQHKDHLEMWLVLGWKARFSLKHINFDFLPFSNVYEKWGILHVNDAVSFLECHKQLDA